MLVINCIAVIVGYAGGFLGGSLLLRRILIFVDPTIGQIITPSLDFKNVGFWIGMCEHFLVVTFVLLDQYTAIGLIFAAKEIVRSDKIREKPSYYLLGTLLSISFAILSGLCVKAVFNLV